MAKLTTNEQLEATDKAYALRKASKNDDLLAESIGISKVTLYTRLKRNNWKKAELTQIDSLHSQLKN